MKTVFAVYYFLTKKDLAFINSPLQFICFIEYFKKFKNNFNILFVGYSKPYNIQSIKKVENFYKKKKFKLRVIYLDEILNIYFFHLILNLRKFFFSKFRTILVGDYRYYLHRKIISIAKKKYLLMMDLEVYISINFLAKKLIIQLFLRHIPQNIMLVK
tara:strand:+ start:8064 stop:8537 length:474 start_codon:yes stop_codon:yes gene_type:complete